MRLLGIGSRATRALAVIAALAALGCGSNVPGNLDRALPTAPTAFDSSTETGVGSDRSSTLGSTAVDFTLARGTFRFAGEQGELIGTYTGVIAAPVNGRSPVRMALLVTGGTGALANASGTIEAVGHGTFAGEGHFTLSMSGAVGGEKYQAHLVGDAAIRCGANGRLISRLRGEGTVATTGRTDMVLESEIVEGFCS